MLNDVTFGQFYPTNSALHKLDPRTKILFLIAYITMLFVANSFYSLALCLVLLAVGIILSKVPFSSVLRSIKGIIFLLAFTAILNLFFHKGQTPIKIWFITIYAEGIIFSIFLMLRLSFLVMASSLLTLTTTPVNLTDGIESLLTPLKWLRFPVHALALIMSIALRFIPTLIDETNRIINAQKSRGADFETGGLIKKVKAVVPILIPLLISAFRRAEELGDAMDARCYSGSENRTKYKKLSFGWRDFVALLLVGVLIAGVILLNIFAFDICPQIYNYMVIR